MGDHSQRILTSALTLSEEERAEIAAALLESLSPDEEAIGDEEFRAELDRRLGDLREGRDAGVDWDELRDQP